MKSAQAEPPEVMTPDKTLELSATQLADRMGVSPRMVNIYREAVEAELDKTIGTKRGRTVYFSPKEQELIIQARADRNGQSTHADKQSAAKKQEAQAQNFQTQNSQTEGQILGDIEGLVEAGDRSAVQLGQQLGQRWANVTIATVLQTMQQGLGQMANQFDELQTAMQLPFSGTPQLPERPQNLLPGQD